METFVLLMVPQITKVVLKSVVMECGVVYVVMSLMKEKHTYCVKNWAMDMMVCTIYDNTNVMDYVCVWQNLLCTRTQSLVMEMVPSYTLTLGVEAMRLVYLTVQRLMMDCSPVHVTI